MSEFIDQAKKLASEHSDQADEGLDKAAEMAGEKTGGKYDSRSRPASRRPRTSSASRTRTTRTTRGSSQG